jgi:hypothetical protein
MDLDVIHDANKWIVEVWEPPHPNWEFREPYPEETYVEINQWCIDNLGYHARTAYHVFEFEKESDMSWFVLRWA